MENAAMSRALYLALAFGLATVVPFAAEEKKDDGFVPMFNGKDLSGWVNVNCAPSTFFVKDGMAITTGKPTGFLRTEKQYENFIADFEWMHIPPKKGAVGNSGFFVWADPIPAVGTGYTRGIEVQVLVNLTLKNKKGEITATSQGDLFSIWGATCVPERPHPDGWARCLPSEDHCKGENEWNHYRVEANDGVIKLTVNGKLVSSVSKCSPRKGYLALESEGSECRFRNLKIKELPSTNPKKEDVADVAQGHKNLYTGLDLSGWKGGDDAAKHWKPSDWRLHFDGKGETLRTEKEYGDAESIVDFRFPKADGKPCSFLVREGKGGFVKLTITPSGKVSIDMEVREGTRLAHAGNDLEGKGLKAAGQWNRLSVAVVGQKSLKVSLNGTTAADIDVVRDKIPSDLDFPSSGAIALHPEGEMDFGNLFVRELKK
jgi:hypothetical protein